MNRSLTAISALLLCSLAFGEDKEFIQALESAQRARPTVLASVGRIAPESEPGTALVVHGRLFAADGRTPLAGAVVFAYHTDREGLYDRPGSKPHTWRLKGWVKTAEDGRFEFRTIRPAPYPRGGIAAHIHVNLFTPDGKRYYGGEVLFADDPLVGAAEREATRRDEIFGSVRQVRREGAVQHVDFNLRVVPKDAF
jgi:protocatechuate 3,4-dioxygenase beta subunit